MNPKVCIVLLNWNQRDDTLACLESLSGITCPSAHIVMVDNNSEDGSAAAVRELFPEVTVIPMTSNVGCGDGRNRGLDFARSIASDFVLFLDNDTRVEPNFLDILLETADVFPNAGILSAKIVLDSDPSTCWMTGGIVKANGTVEALHYYEPCEETPTVPYKVDWAPGCVLFVRREVCEKIGGFDPAYSFYFEDIDFCLRAKSSGYEVMIAPDAVVFHKVSRSMGGEWSGPRLYYWSRNRLIFAWRQTAGLKRTGTVLRLLGEDLLDGLGDIFLLRQPRRAGKRWKGALHFFLRRSGFYPSV